MHSGPYETFGQTLGGRRERAPGGRAGRYPVGDGPDPEASSPPPTRLAELGWMATKGPAWLFRRSRDLVPALTALALREWLVAENAPERDAASETAIP